MNIDDTQINQANTWLIKFIVEYCNIEVFEQIFQDISLCISCFEYKSNPSFESCATDEWIFNVFFDKPPNHIMIEEILASKIVDPSIQIPKFSIEKIINQDWVSEVQKTFKPLIIEDFYIYNSCYTQNLPNNKYNILIDAGRAFGTGEHETTSLCLKAISYLAKFNIFSYMLDIGCGSGILAIAMAKIWSKQIVATDIDEIAVKVAKDNAVINKVDQYIEFDVCEGYNSNKIKKLVKFDLVTANILAAPLIELALPLSKHLNKGGFAILSGLLSNQENEVINAHKLYNFEALKIFRNNGWSALILTKI